MKLTINHKRGFSLIEMILVLALTSLAFIGLLSYEKRRAETLRGEAAGEQFEELGKALSGYISNHNAVLTAAGGPIPATGNVVEMPLAVLTGVNSGPFLGKAYLPTTFSNQNAFGTGYRLFLRNNGPIGAGVGSSVIGLVISDRPVTDETGSVRYDWLGYALRTAGAASGMTFFSTTQVTGLNAGWTMPSTNFNPGTPINAAGLLAYRTQFQNTYDDTYLRRDGLYPMIGDLNMGNYTIRNATDINFNGWLNGNNALLNNLETGYLRNSGNMVNEGNIRTGSIRGSDVTASLGGLAGVPATAVNSSYADFQTVAARNSLYVTDINKDRGINNSDIHVGRSTTTPGLYQGKISAKDIYIQGETTGGRNINGWLSDRLPRYSSRGIVLVNNLSTVSKVDCGAQPVTNGGGIPKIEIIPQTQFVQGRVSPFEVQQVLLPTGETRLTFTQNQYSIGAFAAYAESIGTATTGSWRVHIDTPQYDPAYNGGTALAHVYCDYGT